jgi:hypothetical protein
MRPHVFLLTVAIGLAAYWLALLALETFWAMLVAAWLSCAVAFYGIVFA